MASLAAMFRLDGGRIRDIRLALGSVGPTVLRCVEAEQWLTGRELHADTCIRRRPWSVLVPAPSPTCGQRPTTAARQRVLLLRLEIHS